MIAGSVIDGARLQGGIMAGWRDGVPELQY